MRRLVKDEGLRSQKLAMRPRWTVSKAKHAIGCARVLLAFGLGLLWVGEANAWGRLGHRVIGHYAEQQLSPQARAEVARLLRGEAEPTLAGVANWADEIRDGPAQRSDTSRWHWINFAGDCQYQAEQECRSGHCLVSVLERFIAKLSDASASDAERSEALKFVVHFVGDAHQPLHAGMGKDLGGNKFQISYKGRGWNLHSVWDTLILSSAGLNEKDLAELASGRLSQTPNLGDPVSWVEASCKIVQHPDFYPPRHKIGDSYLDAKRPLAETQLAKAGARLAALLNKILVAETNQS